MGGKMLVYSYLLVIIFEFQWTISKTFVITENLPGENDLEANMMQYLRDIKWLKENRWDAFKTAIKKFRKKKNGIKLCKLSRVLQQHLCRSILSSEKFKISGINEKEMKKCRKQKVKDSDELYDLNMVACVPNSAEDKLYLLSSTGQDRPTLYLFHREKTGEGRNTDRLHLMAEILLVDSDLKELKRIKRAEFKRKWDKVYYTFFETSSEQRRNYSSSDESLLG